MRGDDADLIRSAYRLARGRLALAGAPTYELQALDDARDAAVDNATRGDLLGACRVLEGDARHLEIAAIMFALQARSQANKARALLSMVIGVEDSDP